MKKRLLLLFLITCLMACLSACGGGDVAGSATGSDSPSNVQSENTNDNSDNTATPTEDGADLTAFEKLFSNGPLPAQDTAGLWGYIDSTGEWSISPAFAEARPFWDSGLALAKDTEGQLWGLIDSSGSYIVTPTFDGIGNYMRDDLFRVHLSGQGWGYINSSGAFAIEPQFDEARDFSNGFARVSSKTQADIINQNSYYELWGYINTSGERITEDIYTEAYDFSGGLACVKVGSVDYGSYGYIDDAGNEVIAPSYDNATSFQDGAAVVHRPGTEAGNPVWAIIDTEGNWLSNMPDDFQSGGGLDIGTSNGSKIYWNNDLTPVRLSDGAGYVYINKSGERVLPKSGSPYANARAFTSEGLAAVTDAATMLGGYIDLDGNWAIAPQYIQNDNFNNGLAFVTAAEGQKSIIDTSGNVLVSLDSRSIINQQTLRTPERILVTIFDINVAETSEKAGFYSIDDGLVINYIFDLADNFSTDYSYALVQYDGLWGIIDKDGNWLIPARFSQIWR